MFKRNKISAILALTLAISMLLTACGSTSNDETDPDVVQTTEAGEETENGPADGYIPAPYEIDEELQGPTEYLEPVFYENTDGPTIGVTLVGVIVQDGLYFKDSNNNQELDLFEDWREPTETRVADLMTKMTTEQKAGLTENVLVSSPTATSVDEVYDEDGKVILSQLMTVTEDALNVTIEEDSDEESEMGQGATLPESERANSTGEILTFESRSGVLRSTTDVETGALWSNAVNMVTEYGAVAKDQPTIPYTIISNPQNDVINIPKSLGLGAAAIGDGDYSLVERFADTDRQIWDAKGIDRMYGPQIDLMTDPRWSRNQGTYTEVPEVNAGIAEALVVGYQTGKDGVQDGDVALIMKHFPGDGAAYNGYESHAKYGQWRPYQTEGSLENYQLVGFQAAIDAGVAGIMPGYSMPAVAGTYGSVAQTYRGVELADEAVANAYNTTMLETLLRDTMGFEGFVNTDSGVITRLAFGIDEDMSYTERKAANINAGSDVIGDSFTDVSWNENIDAIEQGLITEEALNRANGLMLQTSMNMGQFDNPYKDLEESKAIVDGLADEMEEISTEMHQKSVVLMKNHENALPLKDTAKKVFIASFTNEGENEDTITSWTETFEGAGYTIVDSEEEADIAFLAVEPGGVNNGNPYMNVIDLVDELEVPEVNAPESSEKTGEIVEVTTLSDVKDIAAISETVHANGGIVLASINITSPWILTNLEPYCDALIGEFDSSKSAQMDVLTGAYNPTGKLPITMVSCNEVVEVEEVTGEDGVTYEICVSPNDVPGYEKDQYMDADVLAQSPSGSYAYQDADGNVYKAYFGLSY